MAHRDEEARNFTVFFPVLKCVVLGESASLFVFFGFLSHNVLFVDRSPLLQKVCFLNQNRMYTTKTMHQQKSINLKFFDPRNTTLY